MLMAADLSHRLGWIDQESLTRVKNLIERAGLPLSPPAELKKPEFIDLMLRDKKSLGGQIRLVLLKKIGQAVISSNYPEELLHATLDHFLGMEAS